MKKPNIRYNKFVYFLSGSILTLSALFIITSLNFQANENDKKNFEKSLNYKIITPFLPEKLSFAGENVPLKSSDVKERIEREIIVNTYWHSNTILALKRAARWFPVIEPILKQNNIPDDFKFLCLIESNLENVSSPAGAVGFWQFLKTVGLQYGLEINSQIDERYDVEKSSEAACKYLNDAYDIFGSWTLAAASFNFGKNGIKKQLTRQKANNYYNLVLGEETSRYIPRAIAMKQIFSNPKLYGFNIPQNERYKPLKTKSIVIDSTISNFPEFAVSYGINYKILKEFNPWLRDNKLINKRKKKYLIKIPLKSSVYVIE